MKKTLLIVPLLLFACNRADVFKIDTIDLPQNGTEIVKSANNAGFVVFNELADSSENSNIMFSPLSLNIPLTMIYNGANADTKTQIADFLGISDYSVSDVNDTYETIMKKFPKVDRKTDLSIANSLWVNQNYSIKQDFKDVVSKKYKATVENMDFTDPKTVTTINDWVDKNTKGKITNILDNFKKEDLLVLINALYFHSEWHYKFPKENTKDYDFYLSDSTKIQVPTMFSEANKYKMATNNNCVIVEMPYSQGNYVMDLIKPDYGAYFDNCLEVLDDWDNVVSNLTEANIEISVPKFEFTKSYDLLDMLRTKFPDAFNKNADFSNLTEDSCYISKVIQKTYVKTDEEGTTAAAATLWGMEATAVEPVVINYDVPFIFIIREVTTGTIMFIGKVADPR